MFFRIFFLCFFGVLFAGCEMEAGSSDVVVADLGGLKVSLPRKSFVVADFEKYKSPEGFRVVRGIGFSLVLPDMRPYSALEKNKVSNEDRIRLLVKAGDNFGTHGEEYLDVASSRYIENKDKCITKCYTYKPLGENEFDLEGYYPEISYRVKPSKERTAPDMDDKNVYVSRGDDGRVVSYITCINLDHENATCQHRFNLGEGYKVRLKVVYKKTRLKDWALMESRAKKFIMDFAID